MRVLGIDPGSETTGWGVIESDGRHYRLVECGTIRSHAGQRFPARLLKIADALAEVIQRPRPEVCAIEDGFLATNVKVTLKLGPVRGVAMLAAERAAIAIHASSAQRILAAQAGAGSKLAASIQNRRRVSR